MDRTSQLWLPEGPVLCSGVHSAGERPGHGNWGLRSDHPWGPQDMGLQRMLF